VRIRIRTQPFRAEAMEKEGAILVESLGRVPKGQRRHLQRRHASPPSEWEVAPGSQLRVIDALPAASPQGPSAKVKKYETRAATVI